MSIKWRDLYKHVHRNQLPLILSVLPRPFLGGSSVRLSYSLRHPLLVVGPLIRIGRKAFIVSATKGVGECVPQIAHNPTTIRTPAREEPHYRRRRCVSADVDSVKVAARAGKQACPPDPHPNSLRSAGPGASQPHPGPRADFIPYYLW